MLLQHDQRAQHDDSGHERHGCRHGGVGIVEEVGSAVKRVKVGDQVIIAITTHCGLCSNCLNGRGDLCYQLATRPRLPSATMFGRHTRRYRVSAERVQ
jgi:Zn-dependent alcohol dehydrogenase